MKKIVITGGHVTPALAVIDELLKKKWEVHYVGRKHALEGDTAVSQEYRLVSEKNLPFHVITTGRLQRSFTRRTLVSLAKIPFGCIQSFSTLLKIRPNIVLSFGGYVAFPIAVSAWFLGIPVVTHEQTLSPGLANKLISYFSRKVCVSWEATTYLFPAQKTVVTGNPLRQELIKSTYHWDLPTDKPLLYVTGGSLGSHSINLLIEAILEELATQYTVVHQCGNATEFQDFERLLEKRKQLEPNLQKHYYVFSYIDAERLGALLKKADVLVSRAGANSLTEIIYFKKPAVMIPLPWSGMGEQEKNAQFLSSQGGALLLLQREVTPQKLMVRIHEAVEMKMEIKQVLSTLAESLPPHPEQALMAVIESVA